MNDLSLRDFAYLEQNVNTIRHALAAAAERGGHPVPELVAVTKSATPEEVAALAALTGLPMAENRVQLLRERLALLGDREPPPVFDLIGSLQKNKVKYVVGAVRLIQSLDSLSLAREIDRISTSRSLCTRVLIEVNSGRESAKGGLLPEEVPDFIDALADLPGLLPAGLMTMGTAFTPAEELRPLFRETKILFDKLCAKARFKTDSPILSMGMSDSFAVAAEEGASMVRVGRALFRRDPM